MRARDLRAGEEYVLKAGKYWDPMRAVVLDPSLLYRNAGGWARPIRHLVDNRVTMLSHRGRGRPGRDAERRLSLAVEGDGTWATEAGRWYPYAARPVEVVEPWAQHAARKAEWEAEVRRKAAIWREQEREREERSRRERELRELLALGLRLEVDAQRAEARARLDALGLGRLTPFGAVGSSVVVPVHLLEDLARAARGGER